MRFIFQFLLIGIVGLAAAEPPEKALRYHQLLMKRPSDETVMTRFVQAWQDEASDVELLTWLQKNAKDGGSAQWRVLAAYQESMGQDGKALTSLDRAVVIEPESTQLRLERAKLRARALKFKEAFADLDVAEKDPKLAKEAATLRGSWLARAGRLEEAGKVWQAVITAYPKDEILREDLIELQVIEGLYDDAIASANLWIGGTRDPYKKALRQLRLAEIQVLGNETAKGLETYQEIMAATGGGTWLEREVLAQTRRVFMREDDVQGYRDFLQKMRQEHPRRVALHKALARQMAMAGEMKEAVGLYREVLKMTPGDLGNLEGFIVFLEENNRWEEARVELQALLERRAEDVELWKRLAGLERQLNQPAGVAAALDEVRKLKSGNATDLVTTSLLYEEYDLDEEAEKMLRTGWVMFPESDEVVEAFANLLLKNGKKNEAREIWMRIAVSGNREELLRVARSLGVQKMRGDALKVIFDRIEEFQEDPLVLTQLCQLTKTKDDGRQILPHALGLVRLAKSPTELESAILLALSVIEVAEMESVTIASLERLESGGIPDLCLLAELQFGKGELGRADETLKKVEGDLLGKFYRVSFDERRGDWKAAVVRLEKIVVLPGQKRTVHLRRLTNLHRRLKNKDAAMKWVEEWKRVAPGDHLAWIVRADLLMDAGRNKEAILELTRLVGKFGPGEGRRVKLAEAQIKVGNGRAAQKIYRKLYEEAGTTEEKLRWLSKWTELAQADGTLKDFLSEFQRRKRENPRSVAPLLALSEIYAFLDRPEEQRRALEEAVDRRDTDPHLLIRLADMEEENGDFEKAVDFLKKADLRDRGEQSKRALAALYFRKGMQREGAEVYKTMPSEIERPRQIEMRVVELIKKGHWAIADEYLSDLLLRFPEDWRLKYFLGVLKKQDWKLAEAAVIFAELEEVRNPIFGLTAHPANVLEVDDANQFWSSEMRLLWRMWGQMTGGQRDLFDRENIYRVLERGHMTALFAFPVSATEVRRKSFLWSLIINEMEFDQAKREAGFDQILAGRERDWRLFALAGFRPVKYRRELEKLMGSNLEDIGLKQQWLASEVKGEAHDPKRLEVVLEELLEGDPVGLLSQFSELLEREVVAKADAWRLARACYDGVKGEGKDDGLRDLLALGRQLPMEAGMLDFTMGEVLAREVFQPNPEDLKPLVLHSVAGGDYENLVLLLNHLVQGMTDQKLLLAPPTGNTPVAQANENFGRDVFRGFNGWSLEWLVGEVKEVPAAGDGKLSEERKLELYAKLGVEVEKSVEGNSVLKRAVLAMDARLFQGKVLMSLGEVAEVGSLVQEMAGSTEIEEVYFAAAYQARVGKLEESYRLFGNLEGLIKVPRDYPEIALGTVDVAYDLVMKNDGVVNLSLAKRAMRTAGNHQDTLRREELARTFGVSPYTRYSPGVFNPRSYPAGIPMHEQRHLGAQLIARLGPDRDKVAVKVAELSLRDLFVSSVKLPARTRPVGRALDQKDLVVDVLQAMKPKDDASADELLAFARMAIALDRRATAGRYFEMVLAIDPMSRDALVGKFMTGKPLAKEAAAVFSLKDHGEEAGHRVRIFIENYHDGDGVDLDLLITLNVIREYLSELPVEFHQDQYLSWVLPCLIDMRTTGRGRISGPGRLRKVTLSDEARNQYREVLQLLLTHAQDSELAFQVLLPLLRPEDRLEVANLSLQGRLQAKRVEVAEKALPMISYPRKSGVLEDRFVDEEKLKKGGEVDLAYLLELGRVSGEVVFEPETLALIKEHLPEFHQDFETARRIGAGADVYQAWLTGLPDDPKLQAARTVSLLKCLIFFGHGEGAWLVDFQEHVATAVVEGAMKEKLEYLVSEWFQILPTDAGASMIRKQANVMLKAALGDQKKWPVLMELGVENFPPAYRERFERFSKAISSLISGHYRSYDVLSELLASGARPFMSDLNDAYLESCELYEISGGVFLRLLKRNGILDREPDGKLSVDRVLLMAEVLAGLPIPGEEMKETLPGLLRQDDAVEPFLKKMLLSHCGVENDLREELELRRDLIVAMEKKDPGVTCHFLGTLYPDYRGSEKLGDVLDRVKTEVLEERLRVLDVAITGGGFELQNRREEMTDLLWEVAKLDAIAAAGAAEKMLLLGDDFFEANPGRVLLPQSRTRIFLSVDRLLNEVLRGPENGLGVIPEEDFWRFFNFLCRSKAGALISAPIGNGTFGGPNFGDVQFPTELLDGFESVQEAMEAKFSNLTAGERQTRVVFHFRELMGFWDKAPGEGDDLEWLEGEAYSQFPELADLLCGLRLAGAAAAADDGDLRKRAEGCFEKYFEKCDLPAVLRMDMVSLLFSHPSVRPCLTSEASWGWIILGMSEYQAGGTRPSPISAMSLIGSIGGRDFVGMGGNLGEFVEVASRAILGDVNSRQTYLRELAVEALIPGAIMAKKTEIFVKLLKIDPAQYKGNLTMIEMLYQSGDREFLPLILLNAKQVYHHAESLPEFSRGSAAKLVDLLAVVPEGERYRLEVLYSDVPDAEGEEVPLVSRPERLLALAKRLKAEGPEEKAARFQILHAFLGDGQASDEVATELRAIEAKEGVGMVLKSSKKNPEWEIHAQIIRKVLIADLAKGGFESTMRHLRSLVPFGWQRDTPTEKEAGVLLRELVDTLFARVAVSPEAARKYLPMTRALMETSLRSKWKEWPELMKLTEGVTVMMHVLAESPVEKAMEGLPKDLKKSYQRFRNRGFLFARLKNLKTDHWISVENKEVRKKVVAAMLENSFVQNDMKSEPLLRLGALTRSGFIEEEELKGIIDGLGAEHPMKSEFLWYRAMVTKDFEKASAGFDKAVEMAVAKKDEDLRHRILFDFVARAFDEKKPEVAEEILKKLDPKKLTRGQQLRVEAMKAK